MNKQDLCRTWKWRITKAGLNQSQFAKMLRIVPCSLCNWVNGKIEPHMSSVEKVENELKRLGV